MLMNRKPFNWRSYHDFDNIQRQMTSSVTHDILFGIVSNLDHLPSCSGVTYIAASFLTKRLIFLYFVFLYFVFLYFCIWATHIDCCFVSSQEDDIFAFAIGASPNFAPLLTFALQSKILIKRCVLLSISKISTQHWLIGRIKGQWHIASLVISENIDYLV